MQDRRVAFGLAATMVALKARAGRLTVEDQLTFAMRAVAFVHDDIEATAAAVDFLTKCERCPRASAERLQDFIAAWADGRINPARSAQILADALQHDDKPDTERRFQ